MKRRVWSEKKTAHAGVPIVSGTEVLTESRLKLEKKKIKNLTNRRSRRRTRSIGRSKKTPAVNHLEAKAVSHR